MDAVTLQLLNAILKFQYNGGCMATFAEDINLKDHKFNLAIALHWKHGFVQPSVTLSVATVFRYL